MNLPPGILNRLQTMPAYSHAQVIGWIRSRNRWRALAIVLLVLVLLLLSKSFSHGRTAMAKDGLQPQPAPVGYEPSLPARASL